MKNTLTAQLWGVKSLFGEPAILLYLLYIIVLAQTCLSCLTDATVHIHWLSNLTEDNTLTQNLRVTLDTV